MSAQAMLLTLRTLTTTYANKLGARKAPSLQLGPGPRCAYNMITHTIIIGTDVLRDMSYDGCCAVLAHEVGHSAEPGFRRWYYLTRALPAIVLACLVGLLLNRNQSWAVTSLCLTLPAVLWAYSRWYPNCLTLSYKQKLHWELQADKRAAQLVGAQAMQDALSEYSLRFNNGEYGTIGAERRRALRKMLMCQK